MQTFVADRMLQRLHKAFTRIKILLNDTKYNTLGRDQLVRN